MKRSSFVVLVLYLALVIFGSADVAAQPFLLVPATPAYGLSEIHLYNTSGVDAAVTLSEPGCLAEPAVPVRAHSAVRLAANRFCSPYALASLSVSRADGNTDKTLAQPSVVATVAVTWSDGRSMNSFDLGPQGPVASPRSPVAGPLYSDGDLVTILTVRTEGAAPFLRVDYYDNDQASGKPFMTDYLPNDTACGKGAGAPIYQCRASTFPPGEPVGFAVVEPQTGCAWCASVSYVAFLSTGRIGGTNFAAFRLDR